MNFYLGTHQTNWLGTLDVPLFVSHRRLSRRRAFPRARAPWALDSGGFTELTMHGRWITEPLAYIDAARRYRDEIGRMDWAAPMDWMCEPFMLAKTGLTVDQHQGRTVENYSLLHEHAPDVAWIPVLQGWTVADYLRCAARYYEAGVDVAEHPVVGVGSVCRRQATDEIVMIFRELRLAGIRCHGFGVKATGLTRYSNEIVSADSMAWSYEARRSRPLAGCTHRACNNCERWALRWRAHLLERIEARERQGVLW